MLVQINAHVYSYYEYQSPVYRFWVNDNLYNEREFWTDCQCNYIEEEIHVDIEPGEHTITIEKVKPVTHAKVWIEKLELKYNNKQKDINLPVDPQNKQIIKFKIE